MGRTIAENLAEAGAHVVLNGRDADRVAAAERALRGRGADVAVCVGDVQRSETARALADTALARWGRIDLLVNNAGINAIKPSLELTDDEWRAVLDTDLSGPFYCSRAVAPAMIRQGGGSIVNISSILGSTAFPQRAAYASAKHGLNGLTKVLATEWGPHGIRVNAISPGMIDVPDKDRSVMRVQDEALIQRTPVRRFGRSEEIGWLICYLASDQGAFISGANIAVDGAWTAFGGW
jgi:3-oxoacyl-[acyl-carrier protein] reductase